MCCSLSLSLFVFKLILITKPTCSLAAGVAGWGPHQTSPSSSQPLWSGDSWVSFACISGSQMGDTTMERPPSIIPVPPYRLQLANRQNWYRKKELALFFVICLILKLQERNPLWLQCVNHYCLFFRAWNELQKGRQSEWESVLERERLMLCCLVYDHYSSTFFFKTGQPFPKPGSRKPMW